LLARKKNIAVAIEKPLSTSARARRSPLRGRPCCRISWYARKRKARRACDRDRRDHGGRDKAYRARKRRLHPAISAALGGAPVVLHDFHEPPARPQAWRDDRFWPECAGD
jgi:hypothetical protein